MGLFNKKELKHIEELENEISKLSTHIEQIGAKSYIEIKESEEQIKADIEMQKQKASKEIETQVQKAENDLAKIREEKNLLQSELDQIKDKIADKKKDLFDIEEELLMQSFGFYTPKYDCMNSDEYAERIKKNREQQKALVKSKDALTYYDEWVLDGSRSKGTAMNNDNMKMVLRAFNNECDVLIDKVKFNNIDKIKRQMQRSAGAIDKLNQRNRITIKLKYINLKIEELELVHEYRVKKQDEKEAMKAARAEEREQAKLQKEIEEARKAIKKEQSHYESERNRLIEQLSNANDEEKALIKDKLETIENQLKEIEKNLEEVDYREANQKAGYVYVISNIGSFGEGIYKIGMTRRLEPQDRVDELGDASVPFTFDVHAMIFSDDAPKLEAALHNAFEDRKVNLINGRKEFFKVSLDEIEKVVKENHDKLIEFKKIPDAEQYRESLLIRNHQSLNNGQ